MRVLLETPLTVEECTTRLQEKMGKPRPLWMVILDPYLRAKWSNCEWEPNAYVLGEAAGDEFWIEQNGGNRWFATPLLFAQMVYDSALNVTRITALTRRTRTAFITPTIILLVYLLILRLWVSEPDKSSTGMLVLVLISLAVLSLFAYSIYRHRVEEEFLLKFLKKTIKAVPVGQSAGKPKRRTSSSKPRQRL